MNYSPEQLAELQTGHNNLINGIDKLESKLLCLFIPNLKESQAVEYAQQGVCRRLQVIKRSVINIYQIFPPQRQVRLRRDELSDVQINLHAFLMNVYGVLDNLAWIYVYEFSVEELKLQRSRNKVGLFIKETRSQFPTDFQTYLTTKPISNWFDDYAKNYRDALAHRIPLYIPPFILTEAESIQYRKLENQKLEKYRIPDFDEMQKLELEQDRLGSICGMFLHSHSDNASRPVSLHPQIIADANTVIEIIEKFLIAFKRLKLDNTC